MSIEWTHTPAYPLVGVSNRSPDSCGALPFLMLPLPSHRPLCTANSASSCSCSSNSIGASSSSSSSSSSGSSTHRATSSRPVLLQPASQPASQPAGAYPRYQDGFMPWSNVLYSYLPPTSTLVKGNKASDLVFLYAQHSIRYCSVGRNGKDLASHLASNLASHQSSNCSSNLAPS